MQILLGHPQTCSEKQPTLGLTLSDAVPISISGENVFLFFEVEGNPPPDYKFHKGFKDLDVEPRYERWTDGGGDHNHVILGIKECRSVCHNSLTLTILHCRDRDLH